MQINPIELNRKEAPPAHELGSVSFIRPEILSFPNGMKVFYINGGAEDVLRLEFIFNAGNLAEHKPLLSNACNYLLSAGTLQRTSAQIAEELDYYGAYYQHEAGFDRASVTLYTLSKHLRPTLAVLKEFLTEPVFPEKEIQTFTENTKQRLLVNLSKNDHLARRAFNQAIFGASHPYGRIVNPVDCDQLNREEIVSFYKEHYLFNECILVVSGKINDDTKKVISDLFTDVPAGFRTEKEVDTNVNYNSQKIYIERPDSVQSALRVGKVMVNKVHPDFIDLQILNTILGGYFGSRLMANVREDKGYTYGIGSGIASMKYAGSFFIATEVGTDVCQMALDEIYKEISLLRTELVPENELNLVRNYMLGTYLGSVENIFSHADKFKSVFFYGLDYDYYENYVNSVKNISSERLLTLAQTYLAPDTLTEVIVGKK